jgi:hypothetical protein
MENFNNQNSIISPQQRLKNAEDEMLLAKKEMTNTVAGGGHAITEDGNTYTKLAGINLPEVYVVLREDLANTIDLAMQDRDVAALNIQDSEKSLLIDACVKSLHEGENSDYQLAYKPLLESGYFDDDKMSKRYVRYYQENYHGTFRDYFKAMVQGELEKIRMKK